MFFFNVFRRLNWFLHKLLIVLGLRRRQQYFGVVYDSVSKQPLDPAIVKLVRAETAEVVATSVTDMAGRYGFLTSPGRYKILARKSNYQFPSQKISGDTDNVYNNLYRGEFFDLMEDSDVVAFNIPMDPLRPDWNQEAKLKVVKFSPFLESFLSVLSVVTFWFVLLLDLLGIYFYPSYLTFGILGFYLLVFLLVIFVPKPRFWGRVYEHATGEPLYNGKLELSHPDIAGIVIAKSNIFEDGKFFLRAEPGRYILKVTGLAPGMDTQLTKTMKIKIRSEGVIYRNIVI